MDCPAARCEACFALPKAGKGSTARMAMMPKRHGKLEK
jgi:hypothetical protein